MQVLNKELVVSRTGLRYVNMFDNKEDIDLKENFNPMISAPFSHLINDNELNRLVTISEYIINHEIKMRIQSGILNPDYPAKIKNKNFLLDIDAFIEQPHYFNNLEKTFEDLHSEIQTKFENLITDKMRKKLND